MHPHAITRAVQFEAPTLVEQRETVRARLAAEKRDLLATSRAVHALSLAWALAGCPGGKFDRWLGGENQEYGEHSTIQDRLRSGEAQAAGLTVTRDSEATNAGRALRAATSAGLPLPAAVQQVQAEIDAGQHRRKATPKAPEGCTFRAIPLFALADLEAAEGELDNLAQTVPGLEIPGGAPEKLALILQTWREQPRELKLMMLGNEDYTYAKKSDLAEVHALAREALEARKKKAESVPA